MTSALLSLLAETSIHVGIGQVGGAIDLPVAREHVTGLPFIPGSGIKGANRAQAELKWPTDGHRCTVRDVFGPAAQAAEISAGALIFGDARLLLLPLRCLNGAYAWATCPYILERLRRDCDRLFACGELWTRDIEVDPNEARMPGHRGSYIYLEERALRCGSVSPLPEDDDLLPVLTSMLPESPAAERLARQLVILNDEDFAWFCTHALPVAAHNQLNDETKESEQLWYEETLPPDSLLYAPVAARAGAKAGNAAFEEWSAFVDAERYLQVGGNVTTGQGWMRTRLGKSAPGSVQSDGASE